MTEKRAGVLEKDELQKSLGVKGLTGKLITNIAYRILELEHVNTVNDKYRDSYGPDYSENILREIGVTYDIPQEQLDRIPAEGGFVTVSNHHFGSIDGMILSSVIGSRRPDYRILTTFLLTYLSNLKDSFIPVDNFSSGGARSISGIRTALAHIADGHPIGFFPAGEVATWQPRKLRTSVSGKRVVEDIPWAENIIKLVKKSGFPIIPIYFEGQNSKWFHIWGKIHPRLRTARLVHEMWNKTGVHVNVRIGAPIMPADIEGMDVSTLGKYLRNRTYALEVQCRESSAPVEHNWPTELAPAVDKDLIRAEIAGLEDHMLFETGDYRAYLLCADEAPKTMKELYRLREETFRAIGEGTGLAEDTDFYDSYYRHMILWHTGNQELVGAYRLGFGPMIMAEHGGIPGFYTSTLFKYGPKAEKYLPISLELGRSFVAGKYQREVFPLKLLLAGLAVCTTKYPELKYVSGPVSISNDLPHFFKSLVYRYITKDYSIEDAERVAKPTHPFVPDYMSVNPDQLLIFPNDNIDHFDRLISALSDGRYRLPVLVRKYFSCSAKLPCFNVDPDFSYSLDGLIFLRLSEFPEVTLKSILRGLPEDLQNKVWMQFYNKLLF
jgi:putative hemolysin